MRHHPSFLYVGLLNQMRKLLEARKEEALVHVYYSKGTKKRSQGLIFSLESSFMGLRLNLVLLSIFKVPVLHQTTLFTKTKQTQWLDFSGLTDFMMLSFDWIDTGNDITWGMISCCCANHIKGRSVTLPIHTSKTMIVIDQRYSKLSHNYQKSTEE